MGMGIGHTSPPEKILPQTCKVCQDAAMDETVSVVVVGVGHLGRHHLRLASSLPCWRCTGAYDTDQARLASLCQEFGVPRLGSLEEAVQAAEAAIVATPTVTHLEVAGRFLQAGRHVLVEKPLAATVGEGEALVSMAAQKDLVLAVGHVEFFNPAVQALLQRAPRPRYLEAQRLSPFSRRSLDVDVVLDLMVHDLQIAQALNPGVHLREIRAVGLPVLSPQEDLANVRLEFANGCVANLTASRVAADRVRKLRVFAPDAYYSVDYSQQSIHAFRLERHQDEPQIAPLIVPVEHAEPLAREHLAFAAAVRRRPTPLVTGVDGLAALQAACAIGKAIRQNT